jgi:hypothetical protein
MRQIEVRANYMGHDNTLVGMFQELPDGYACYHDNVDTSWCVFKTGFDEVEKVLNYHFKIENGILNDDDDSINKWDAVWDALDGDRKIKVEGVPETALIWNPVYVCETCYDTISVAPPLDPTLVEGFSEERLLQSKCWKCGSSDAMSG